jgi:hypothetical protein
VPGFAINEDGQGRENQADQDKHALWWAGFTRRVSWGMRIKCRHPVVPSSGARLFGIAPLSAVGRRPPWSCRSPAGRECVRFLTNRARAQRRHPRSSDLLHIEVDAIKNRALIDHKHCKLFENVRELLNGLR